MNIFRPHSSPLSFLLACGYTLDENGRAVPLVVGPDPFAVALMPVPKPTIPDGPSAKTLRRREKLAARAKGVRS